jgi:hypothetical protein
MLSKKELAVRPGDPAAGAKKWGAGVTMGGPRPEPAATGPPLEMPRPGVRRGDHAPGRSPWLRDDVGAGSLRGGSVPDGGLGQREITARLGYIEATLERPLGSIRRLRSRE